MITENLSTLKINKLTREQYEAALEAGNINENELYMIPEEDTDALASIGYVDEAITNLGVDKLTKNWGIITIPVSGWSSTQTDGWYTNQVAVTDMTADYNPYADVVYTSSATVSDEDSAFSCIKEIETGAGIIIAKAIELPTIDVKIRLMGI